MEKLVNCDIIISIELIEIVSGGNQAFEILFSTRGKEKYKIIFNFVWDMRYSIENGYIDRFSNFVREIKNESNVLLVENSEYVKYFEKQVSGTRSVDQIKNYILFDNIDTVIEILTVSEPLLVKV